jgi:heme exporter protein D
VSRSSTQHVYLYVLFFLSTHLYCLPPWSSAAVSEIEFVRECMGACVRRLKVLQGLVQNERRRLEAKKTLKSLFSLD